MRQGVCLLDSFCDAMLSYGMATAAWHSTHQLCVCQLI